MVTEKLIKLRNEVNCRIEHGAEGADHLSYIQDHLDDLIAASKLSNQKHSEDHSEITSRGQKIKALQEGLDGLAMRHSDLIQEITQLRVCYEAEKAENRSILSNSCTLLGCPRRQR